MNLIGSEICGNAVRADEVKALSDEELKALYKLSKSHDLAHLVGNALIKNDLISNNKINSVFEKELYTAVFRYESINYELGNIKEILSENEIPFIPLKGSVIRDYYPEPWMRTSCDIDILVREENIDKAVKELVENGYTKERKNYHDVSLYSVGGVHLELHFSILELKENIDKVLSRAWDYAKRKDGFEYSFTNEFFLYHNIAHASYHFIGGGCGVRPFVDLFILLEKLQYDVEKLNKLLIEAGIKTFADKMEELSEVWFEDGEHTDVTRELENFVLSGGVYGTLENGVSVGQNKKGGKIKYILSRVWLSYDVLKVQYPNLEKHKWLLPFYEVKRWLRLLFKGGVKRSVNEIKVTANMDSEKVERSARLMSELGLIERKK